MAYIVVNDMVLHQATAPVFVDPKLDILEQEVDFEFSDPRLDLARRGIIRNYNYGQLYPPREA
jgi:hypothetical protein